MNHPRFHVYLFVHTCSYVYAFKIFFPSSRWSSVTARSSTEVAFMTHATPASTSPLAPPRAPITSPSMCPCRAVSPSAVALLGGWTLPHQGPVPRRAWACWGLGARPGGVAWSLLPFQVHHRLRLLWKRCFFCMRVCLFICSVVIVQRHVSYMLCLCFCTMHYWHSLCMMPMW